jgi:hypothetical protein
MAELQSSSLETQAHDVLRVLHSLQNTLRPINRLPPEIIPYIARRVLEGDDVDVRSIVPLTHVCQYWRNSIVSTPGNWSLISSNRRKLAELSLGRVKAVPLTIHLDLDRLKREPRVLSLLVPQLENIQHLLSSGFYTIEELTQPLSYSHESMPNLRSLVLTRSSQADWSRHTDPFDFPADSTLRELSLSSVPLFPSILSLRILTKFSLFDQHVKLHVDTLLSFLEENQSLEDVALAIEFAEHSLRCSQRQTLVGNTLQRLSISDCSAWTTGALVSSIPLQKGATLEIRHDKISGPALASVFSGVSATRLQYLSSPIVMEFRIPAEKVRLLGFDGSFSYEGCLIPVDSFGKLPLSVLASVRKLLIESHGLTKFCLSSFPSLEVLTIDGGSNRSSFPLTPPDPTFPPLLKTLALLNCIFASNFVTEFLQFASNYKTIASASLHRVVIVNSSDEQLPGADFVERLKRHVPLVEVMVGRELPKNLD